MHEKKVYYYKYLIEKSNSVGMSTKFQTSINSFFLGTIVLWTSWIQKFRFYP